MTRGYVPWLMNLLWYGSIYWIPPLKSLIATCPERGACWRPNFDPVVSRSHRRSFPKICVPRQGSFLGEQNLELLLVDRQKKALISVLAIHHHLCPNVRKVPRGYKSYCSSSDWNFVSSRDESCAISWFWDILGILWYVPCVWTKPLGLPWRPHVFWTPYVWVSIDLCICIKICHIHTNLVYIYNTIYIYICIYTCTSKTSTCTHGPKSEQPGNRPCVFSIFLW